MNRMNSQFDRLWAEYRAAVPDVDASADFMPRLWQRIDARRTERLSLFRRMTQVCVLGTLALALMISVILPEVQHEQSLNGNYVDVVAAEDSVDYATLLALDVAR